MGRSGRSPGLSEIRDALQRGRGQTGAHQIPGVEGVSRAVVDLVWVPTWHQGMLSEAAKLQLGLM